MNIFFDGQIFSAQNSRGISRYFINLINRLSLEPSVSTKIGLGLHSNELFLDTSYQNAGYYFSNKCSTFGKMVSVMSTACVNAFNEKKINFDLIHRTYYFPPILKKNMPEVLTVFDMMHELFPENYKNSKIITKLKKQAIDRSDKIICISENTKLDLQNIFNVPQEKLHVIHLSHSFPLNDYNQWIKNKHKSTFLKCKPINYILYVGARVNHKNFVTLVKSYAKSLLPENNIFIGCFGGSKFTLEEKELFLKYQVSNKIMHFGNLESNLYDLYKNALLFVCPSFYEGFGLPIVEAMSVGCPVLTSNLGSLKEVLGNGGMRFDPKSTEELTKYLNELSFDFERLSIMSKKSFKRSQDFSWDKCAKKTYKIYQEIC